MDTVITKRQKLLSVRNEWVCGDYWLVHGRMYNEDRTYFRRFKFVLHIDLACDLWDAELEEDRNYDDVLEEMIWCFVEMAGDDYHDDSRLNEFYDRCNETILQWNGARH